MNKRLASLCPSLDQNNGQTAIFEKGAAITYGELAKGIDNLSANILRTGVAPGSRIALCFDNSVSFIYGYMAILAAECIPVLLSPGLPSEKLVYILADSNSAGMVCNFRTLRRIPSYPSSMRFVFSDEPVELSKLSGIAVYSFDEGIQSIKMHIEELPREGGDAEALPSCVHEITSIIYTSGTTGKPKGVMLSETNLVLASSAINRHLGTAPADTCFVTMSFAHCAGLLHMIAHLRVGAKLVTGESPALIGQFLTSMRRHCVTVLPGVPSFFSLLLKHPVHKVAPYLQHVRTVETSSAVINSSLIREIASLFPSAVLFNTYGLTEAPRATYMAVTPTDMDTNLSVGLPTAKVSINVVDAHLRLCRPYEEGEIIISGPNIALGYWNNPERTGAVFSPAGFKTGDVGYRDKNGFLFLKGRTDDRIKIGAEVVYPSEIEEVIGTYPGITDVMAYGVEDDLQGAVIIAKVVCKDKTIESKDILDYCRLRLEKHKLPSIITFCDSIALEESGKPKRGK
jgi:long-chain acyl-CoA synthetase